MMTLLLMAIGILLLGACAALLAGRRPMVATVLGAGGAVAGCAVGLVPAWHGLWSGTVVSTQWPWPIPGGQFHVQLDALSAFFLLPILLISALAAVYGGGYMLAYRDRKSLGPPWFFFNLFVAGMVLVVVARQALLFMIAWEVMSMAAFFLVVFEHEKEDVREAGWVYLVATHLGAACLLAMFLFMGRQAGSLDFDQMGSFFQYGPAGAGVVLGLALIGFGAKAGLVPLHVWLPEAHPAAPSHVSALMSGVMIKLGIYGILRILMFLGPPAVWWGPLLMAIGLAGAVLGISMALMQRDLKRSLAYSSIENVGLILLALGTSLWGAARGHPLVALLGLGGGLLHVWNHSLMKSLMFLCAGSVLHGAGTRDMERLGGLMKPMPWTGVAMVLGAVALAAVPPLNGFISEWMIYMSLLHGGLDLGGISRTAMLTTVGILSLIGGLALVCFVRLIGIIWLGEPRSEGARHAHESPVSMLAPIATLALLCLLAALFPGRLLHMMAMTVQQISGLSIPVFVAGVESAQSPVAALGTLNVALFFLVGVCAAILWWCGRRGARAVDATWGCGYVAPTSRMQYTGRSFSEMMVTRVFPRWLRPGRTLTAPHGLFPAKGGLTTQYSDPVDKSLYQPFFRWFPDRCARLRWVQQGRLHYYMFYFVVVLVLAFAWIELRNRIMP
jgi:formate hydrogenlyase subunit 3/multisubunit Na+/H+ antiporter MnhD subunit